MAKDKPTADDYSRLLDDLGQRIVDLIVKHDRLDGRTSAASVLREAQAFLNAERSKRGL